MAAAVTGLVVGDDPALWADLGFAVEDGHVDIAGVRISLTGDGSGLRRWSVDGIAVEDGRLEGLRTDEAPPAPPGPEHPNRIVEVDHVVVWTPDVDRTIEALAGAGLELRRERRTDSYGSPMRQAFFRPAGAIIEVVGGDEPQGDGPARFFGIALTSADLDATAAVLGDRLKPPKDAVQPGRRIATIASSAGVGVPIAIMSPQPRPGGDQP